MSDWRESESTDRAEDIPDPGDSDLTPEGRGAIRGETDSSVHTIQAPTDARQIADAVTRLQQMPEIRPETWGEADLTERLHALESVETVMAEVQRRPARELLSEETGPGQFGYFNGEKIHVSQEVVEGGTVHENIDTVIHEGRHAYQQYAIHTPEFHPDDSQVESWRQNLSDYKDPQFDLEEYRNQPLEADAWEYAETILSGLYGDGRQGDQP